MWENTSEDIETTLKLKYGFIQAKHTQEFQMLATVVSSALGGKQEKSKPPENFSQAQASFGAVFGNNKVS